MTNVVNLPTYEKQELIKTGVDAIKINVDKLSSIHDYSFVISGQEVGNHAQYLVLEVTGKGVLTQMRYTGYTSSLHEITIQMDDGIIYKIQRATTSDPGFIDVIAPFNNNLKVYAANESFATNSLKCAYLID